jgi:hypothetical protein
VFIVFGIMACGPPCLTLRQSQPGPAGTKFEIQSTKSETNSNPKMQNDKNSLARTLEQWFAFLGHSGLFRISIFVLRI